MIKRLKQLSITLIIISILCYLGGMGFSKLAKENQGSGVTSVQVINGKIVTRNAGNIGANKEGEETAKAMSAVFYVVAGLLFISGIGIALAAKNKNSIETTQQHGIVLEKENSTYTYVIVEFDDKSRRKLIVEPQIIVAKGDRGIIGYKNDLLVEFTKE